MPPTWASGSIPQGETIIDFLDLRLARQLVEHGRRAELAVANDVLAQMPESRRLRRGSQAPAVAILGSGLQIDRLFVGVKRGARSATACSPAADHVRPTHRLRVALLS